MRELPECPCGCLARGFLTKREPQHSRNCTCKVHQGRRNRQRGQRSQSAGYKKLGGKAQRSPSHEEWMEVSEIHVKWENKSGAQVPATFSRFIATDWFRRALSQADRSIPVGVQAYPGVRLDLGRGQDYLVVALAPMPRSMKGAE